MMKKTQQMKIVSSLLSPSIPEDSQTQLSWFSGLLLKAARFFQGRWLEFPLIWTALHLSIAVLPLSLHPFPLSELNSVLFFQAHPSPSTSPLSGAFWRPPMKRYTSLWSSPLSISFLIPPSAELWHQIDGVFSLFHVLAGVSPPRWPWGFPNLFCPSLLFPSFYQQHLSDSRRHQTSLTEPEFRLLL